MGSALERWYSSEVPFGIAKQFNTTYQEQGDEYITEIESFNW